MESLPIRLVIVDIDGTLTDGGYYVTNDAVMKKYNTKDFVGMFMLHQVGVKFGVITGEKDRQLVINRFAMAAPYIPEEDVYTDAMDKLSAAEDLIKRHNVPWSAVAFIGDELNDLELLKTVGFPGCPADATREVYNFVAMAEDGFTCLRGGGQGAVREFCEAVLAINGYKPFWQLKKEN
jgi:YrbI family 3-deoxy-D-manno-octulosonate 8-phosphate phosphatase